MLRAQRHQRPICPVADLRNVYYGLLGPDALNITYRSATGKLVTTPTGPDGAYLIVRRGGASINNDGYTYDSGTVRGPITAIHYRDGHTCRPGRCPPVGYVSPARPLPTQAQVTSPISVRTERANVWCVALTGKAVPKPGPCKQPVPTGFQQLQGGPASVLVVFSFISRVPVTNGHSYYYFNISRPPHRNPRYGRLACAGTSEGGQTNADYSAGERVVLSSFENLSCQGVAHGNIRLVITTGPTSPAPMPASRGQSVGREVGHFSFKVP